MFRSNFFPPEKNITEISPASIVRSRSNLKRSLDSLQACFMRTEVQVSLGVSVTFLPILSSSSRAWITFMWAHTCTWAHTHSQRCCSSLVQVRCGLLQSAVCLSHSPCWAWQTDSREIFWFAGGSGRWVQASSDAWSCCDMALPLCEIRTVTLRWHCMFQFKPIQAAGVHWHSKSPFIF